MLIFLLLNHNIPTTNRNKMVELCTFFTSVTKPTLHVNLNTHLLVVCQKISRLHLKLLALVLAVGQQFQFLL